MYKFITITCLLIVCILCYIISYYFISPKFKNHTLNTTINNNYHYVIDGNSSSSFDLFTDNKFIQTFNNLDDAIAFAQNTPNSFITEKKMSRPVWDNFKPYNVFVNYEDTFTEFDLFKDAVNFAKKYERSFIYYRKNNTLIWSVNDKTPTSHHIQNVPLIKQLPELDRGCEVTSLAMLLNYHKVKTDKITLANEITRDRTPYEIINGVIYFGNPHDGFVGDMKNIRNPGLGVYNEPIYQLLETYFPYSSLNLTGSNFEDLLQILSHNFPIWVITNTKFTPLPSNDFQTWQTPTGQIEITYRMHSVLVTGYDENNIYFHDPLNNILFAPKENFIKAWEQLGSQAVTIIR